MGPWYPNWYPKNSGCLLGTQRMGVEVGASERVERWLYKGASGSAALGDNPDTHTSRDQGRRNAFLNLRDA